MSKAINDLNKILGKLSKTVQESISRERMQAVGNFAALVVVKRTRLGDGVRKNFGEKDSLDDLSDSYIVARKKYLKLDGTTRATKSNLTQTGQMLRSMKAQYKGRGIVFITPTGTRKDGLTNLEVAGFAQDDPGKRPFNRVSEYEFGQILRFYRKTFGDLVRKSSKGSLIR